MTPERILRAAEILRELAADVTRNECIHSGDDFLWPDGTEEAQSACNEMSGLAAELEALSESHLALEPGRDYTVVPVPGPHVERRGEVETPRTDAKRFSIPIAGGNHYVVFATVAQELERELAAMTLRAEQAERERDEARGKADRLLNAEHALSDSYVTVREIIGAMDPPSMNTMAPEVLWDYVEQTARELVARVATAEHTAEKAGRDAERYRFLRRLGASPLQVYDCEKGPYTSIFEDDLDAAIDALIPDQQQAPAPIDVATHLANGDCR